MIRTKFLICLSATLVCFQALSAIETLVEGKAAYFLPQRHKFRRIYSGGGMYGLEISGSATQNLYGWVSVDSFTKKGTSLGAPHRTRISMIPLAIGVKYFTPLCCLPADLYVGAGLLGTHVRMHDHSPYVKRHPSKWGIGGIAKLGVLFNYGPCFVDLFTNYSYCHVEFHGHHGKRKVYRNSMNVGGWIFGAGLGYRFCL